MSVKVEKLEKNMAKLTFEVSAEEFEAACQRAYLKNRSKISLPGFRKGKAPRKMIEKMYGKGFFYEDAINDVLPNAYEEAVKESGLEVVSRPSIDIDGTIQEGQPVAFTAEVAVKPEVTLGQYKGVEVTKKTVEVSDAEIDAELNADRQKNSRKITVDDRAVENGDIVNINYRGTVDGIAFDGGTAEDYELTIGSHSFIDTFEDQIIGHEIGDEFDVNVTFPEEYHAEELAGKPAVFAVKVNGITKEELPELDDEFASEVSEFDTLAEYREDVRARILNRKTEAAKTQKENEAVDAAVANAQMEIPDAMIESQAEQMVEDFANQLRSQGMELGQYLQWTGMDEAKMMESMKPQAVKRIQTRLTLEAIAEAENLEVTDEEVDAEIGRMAESYGVDKDMIKNYMGEQTEALKTDLKVQKAVDLVAAEAVEVEPKTSEEE
ncbi:MAG: trigger factor [Lachnospiraceae bacterium]|nr:trigger factor [Lachnospiraceae bacterium]